MSEGQYIGWDYSESDIEAEQRERTGKLNEFEQLLEYHEITAADYHQESSNQQRHLWWNFRKFKKEG